MSVLAKLQDLVSLSKREHKMETAYESLITDADSDGDSETHSEKLQRFQAAKAHSRLLVIFPWLLTLLLALTCFLQLMEKRNAPVCPGTFERGWATDFYPAKSVIEVEKVKFSGSPSFDANGSILINNPDPIEYNGKGPEVDEAWERLTGGRYILITAEEARNTWGEGYTEFWDESRGGYIAGLDMFHTLHCVNRLRQMTPEILTKIEENHNHRLHHYHCLSQIRQYIMCSGDMTPIPTKYYESIERNYVDSDYHHTCRNFQQLRDWTWERYNGSLAVEPKAHP